MEPLTPDVHGIAVLLLIVAALILFTRDRLPLESSALAVLIALIVGFELFPYEANGVELSVSDFLSGFGHEALISICSLILIGKGLETTGALQPLARLVAGMMESRPRLALLLMLVAVACASAFVNDTPIVVLMIPVLVGISVRRRLPLSVMLLPMGLATIIGGMTTSIGTSTNLLVVSLGKELQAAEIAMFDFVLPAAIVGSVGLVFVWLAAPYILPRRHLLMEDESQRIFLAELLITSGSRAADKPLSEVLALVDTDMRIERIRRGENSELARLPSVVIRPGDRLLVRDNPENLMEIERQLGATFIGEEREQGGWDRLLAEVVTGEDVVPIAVHRARYPGSVVRKEIEKLQLRIGDVLLVQGTQQALGALKENSRLMVLDGTIELRRPDYAKRALAVLVLVVSASATGVLPIAISALTGVGLMIALRCLTWRDASRAIPVPVVILIVASLALGKALVATGMAQILANEFVTAVQGLPPALILSLFLLAVALGADPVPFLLAVLFGANMSFITPFGYHTNLLILSAGNYRFIDFIKVGLPLAVIMWLGFSLVLPMMYELSGYQTGGT
jgi:di/tricarboxylate transporter